jgi:hypothetical protein
LDTQQVTNVLVTIVEGQGDVEAVPVLVRRLLALRGQYWDLKPIRVKRQKVVKPEELERAIKLAVLQGCASVLVVLDADKDCPAELGPGLQARAEAVAPGLPVAVVLANQEFEAWLLGGIDGLRGRRGISAEPTPVPDPDAITSPKGRLEREMGERSYLETDDQAAFAALMDIEAAERRSRSFRKLIAELGRIIPPIGA